MNVLILGGEGMLGHAVARELGQRPIARGRVGVTIRGARPHLLFPPLVKAHRNVDALKFDTVREAIKAHEADAVINAIGIVKNRREADDAAKMFEINGRFPHKLASHCAEKGIKLIHISTDCVFDGTRGSYSELDKPNANDLYGRSKAVGEVEGTDILTLRTSMIGLEPLATRGLVSWFLAEKGPVLGYKNAIFSGPTTPELARLVARILSARGPFGGLMHVAAAPIDKCTLLEMARDAFGLATKIRPDGRVCIDRSLHASRLTLRYGYNAPTWEAMIDELARTHKAGKMGAARGSAIPIPA